MELAEAISLSTVSSFLQLLLCGFTGFVVVVRVFKCYFLAGFGFQLHGFFGQLSPNSLGKYTFVLTDISVHSPTHSHMQQ